MTHAKQGRGEQDSLADFCLSTARLYRQNPSKVTGKHMAQLASRLVSRESRPGGPYLGPDHTPDFFTNLAVGYLFALFKKPLPNVTAFIETTRNTASSPKTNALLKKYDLLLYPSRLSSKPNALHGAIFATAKQQLRQLSQPEKATCLFYLDKVHQADENQEIALIATLFADSLALRPASLPLHQLGVANIYCWMAYSIYDEILDSHPAPAVLPVANITMRKSMQMYQELFPADHPFQAILQRTFTSMDHANAWEIAHARFQRAGKDITISDLPQYGSYNILADRCSGHILGPLAITILCDVSSECFAHIEKGLRHYLIARQLSDDIHDWKEDFTAGHISSTVSHILTQVNAPYGPTLFTPLLKKMQTHFWQSSMKSFTEVIVRHLKKSRYHLMQSGLLNLNSTFFCLHNRLEAMANTSLQELQSSHEFLATYALTANDSRPLPQTPQP